MLPHGPRQSRLGSLIFGGRWPYGRDENRHKRECQKGVHRINLHLQRKKEAAERLVADMATARSVASGVGIAALLLIFLLATMVMMQADGSRRQQMLQFGPAASRVSAWAA